MNALRVDGEIFESGKKKLRIKKYLDTCRRGLKVIRKWPISGLARGKLCDKALVKELI